MRRHPAVPYVLPFAVYIALLALQQIFPVPIWVRFVIPLIAILVLSREPLRSRPVRPLLSILVGVMVFIVWVGPDLLFPAWRNSVLFNNSFTGRAAGNTPAALKHDPIFLFFRIATSAVAVPVLEELFWRGWLMRWLIDAKDFRRVPLGAYAPAAFWLTAILFASEHGSFWDVGLLAGIIYNWWIIRTRNLWDCIIAHAVTNGVLAAYVTGAGQWQYWI